MQDVFLRRIAIAIVTCVVLATGAIALAMTVTFEPFGVPETRKQEYEQKLASIHARRAARFDDSMNPRVVVPVSHFDFGLMDPLTEARHSFAIRNEGELPLVLKGGQTSCKCTLVEGQQQIIDPGDTGSIDLFWNTGPEREVYKQTAKILTNDPSFPELQLSIEGRVRFEIGTSQDSILFMGLAPDGVAKRKIEVFSQIYNRFTLTELTSSMPGLSWDIQPLTGSQLQEREALSGYEVAIELPLGDVKGAFSGVFRFTAVPEDAASRKASGIQTEIPFQGKVPKRLSVVGAGLSVQEGWLMGVLDQGRQHTKKLFLRVHGDKLPERMRVSKIEPDFLEFSLQPSPVSDKTYVLEVTVPADAPKAIFNVPGRSGVVEVECDLLDDGKLTLPILGAVLPKRA